MTQMDLTDIYRIFHPNTKEYNFSAPHGIFSKTDHIFSNKANLNKYKKVEITLCILSDHHGLKLEFNNNTNFREPTNTWKLKNTQLNHHWVNEEIKKLKVSKNSMKITAQHTQTDGTQ